MQSWWPGQDLLAVTGCGKHMDLGARHSCPEPCYPQYSWVGSRGPTQNFWNLVRVFTTSPGMNIEDRGQRFSSQDVLSPVRGDRAVHGPRVLILNVLVLSLGQQFQLCLGAC